MSTATAHTVTLTGVQGTVVRAEVDAAPGVPGLALVGLPDTAVREARDRIRAAIANSGKAWRSCKVTVSLSPAEVRKRGSGFDLALACACLAAFEDFPAQALAGWVMIGELGLDGTVRPVRGVLPMVMAAVGAGWSRLAVAEASGPEAALVPGVEVAMVETLDEMVRVLKGEQYPRWCRGRERPDRPCEPPDGPDLHDVCGQATPRLAVEVAAAGGHHLLLHGSPGAGKSLLAERLPGLLPCLTEQESLEVTAVHSVAGALPSGAPVVTRPPFQAPHHTASAAAIVGGGVGVARPGAVSLAHRGVLFLDETPEFHRSVLDTLRQPMERGEVHLARGDATVTYPARFQLVMAANPCPCGKGAGRGLDCVCTPDQKRRYSARLSGPLLDRVDLQVPVLPVSRAELLEGRGGESSASVRDRVRTARERASRRYREHPWSTNAELPGSAIRSTHRVDAPGADLARDEVARGRLSARGMDRVLRVSWTLADLAGRDRPGAGDVATAIGLRGGGLPWAA
jgi:magnesium chelatase family protein